MLSLFSFVLHSSLVSKFLPYWPILGCIPKLSNQAIGINVIFFLFKLLIIVFLLSTFAQHWHYFCHYRGFSFSIFCPFQFLLLKYFLHNYLASCVPPLLSFFNFFFKSSSTLMNNLSVFTKSQPPFFKSPFIP